MRRRKDRNEVVEAIAKTVEQTERAETLKQGILAGAKNHREINKNDKEWYEERDKRREQNAPKVSAFVEFTKNYVAQGAEEQARALYETIRDNTLKKLMQALADDEEGCKEFFRLIEHLRELNKRLNEAENIIDEYDSLH